MKHLVIALFLAISMVSTPCFADEASHKKAVIELLEVTNSRKMLDQIVVYMDSMMRQQFLEMDLPPEENATVEQIQKEMMDWFSEYMAWENMQQLYIEIYIEVFTEEEIKELVAFYKSPLGQKLLAKMPELMEKSMTKTQAVLQKKMPEFQERLQKKMAELEEKHNNNNDK